MLDDLDAIIERLKNKALTDNDIQLLSQLLQRNVNQDILQSGKFNVAIGEGTQIYVGDRYTGATLEQIRLIIQELQTLQSSCSNAAEYDECAADEPLFHKLTLKLTLDLATLEAVSLKLEVLEEIYQSGYLSDSQKQDLRQLKQRLQTFSNLNQDLQSIAEQGDRLIQDAVATMQLQLDALKLAGKTLIEEAQSDPSPAELECQQAETEIFQTFVNHLEDSQLGAEWIGQNMQSLIRYASNIMLRQFPDSSASKQEIEDFKFSLKQFLEQVNFSLYWGTYEILDSPEIPLVLGVEQYETAFQAMKECISKRLPSETILEIEACFDYLIDRLRFY